MCLNEFFWIPDGVQALCSVSIYYLLYRAQIVLRLVLRGLECDFLIFFLITYMIKLFMMRDTSVLSRVEPIIYEIDVISDVISKIYTAY